MSILLSLENISCYTKAEFTFSRGKLILIKGPSGVGKSSIFKAITWILYGTLKGICNFNSNKCSGTFITPEIKVTRSNKSPKLQVISEAVLYDNETVAQSIIDKIYGNEEIWNVTCYLEQDSRSLLLGGTNNERMEILNKLSFWSDNPEKYIERIDMEIKYQQDLFIREQSSYMGEVKAYEDEIKNDPVDYKYNLTKEQLENLSNQLIKLVDKLKQLTIDNDTQSKFLGSIDMLENKLNQNILTLKNYFTPVEYKRMINDIDASTLELLKQQDKVNYEINVNSKDIISIKNQLESKERELISLSNQKNNYLNSLNMYNNTLNGLNTKLSLLKKTTVEKYVDLNQYPGIDINKLTRRDLYEQMEKEKQRVENINKCKMLSIEYSQSDIIEFINKIKLKINELILYKADAEIITNIKIYKEKISQMNCENNSLDITDILPKLSQAEKKYNDIIISRNLHKCPHCYKTIRYVNGEMLGDNSIVYTKQDLQNIEKEIKDLKDLKSKLEVKKSYNDYIEKLMTMLKILKSDDEVPNDINHLDSYKQALVIAEQIKVIPVYTVSTVEISKILEYLEALTLVNNFDINQIDLIEVNINNINNEILKIDAIIGESTLDSQLKDIRNKIKDVSSNIETINQNNINELRNIQLKTNELNTCKIKYQQCITTVEYINKDIDIIKNELLNLNSKIIPNIRDQLNTTNTEIEMVKLWKTKGTQLLKIVDKYDKLKKKEIEINERNKLLAGLYSLKQIAFDLECTHLQTTVDSINESLNDILQNIFEKPIKVILNLYKKNKSNDKIRANVNLTVQYDGNEYDNLNKLSGGEKDRISFALTLALSRLNGTEFLLLDETLRSLNDEYRTLCLEALKNFFGTTKTILCINHEDVEGNYDNVIQL